MYNNNSFIRLLVAGFVIIVIVFICNEIWQTTVTGQEYYLDGDDYLEERNGTIIAVRDGYLDFTIVDDLTPSDLSYDLFQTTKGYGNCFAVDVVYHGLQNFKLNRKNDNFQIAHYNNFLDYYKDAKQWLFDACGINDDLLIVSN